MDLVYNIISDQRTKIIQNQIIEKKLNYRTKFGFFGTVDWLKNLRKEGKIEVLEGTISRIFMSGHNDFPMFEIQSDNRNYEFERLGDSQKYVLGKKVLIETTKNQYISPISGLENTLIPLLIKIGDN